MDLVMDAVSATARYLGDPPAAQRGTESVTKREAIVIVTATATLYFFWPERLWIFKAIFNIALLGWLTGLAFDAKEAGIEAWDGIPMWLKNYLGGGAGASSPVQRCRVSKRESPGQFLLEHVQGAINKLRSAQLTQDVWGVVRVLLIHFLRTALHYLEPPQESPKGHATPASSHFTTQPKSHQDTPSQRYGILVRTPPVHGYGSFGPTTTPWDDMEMDTWHTPESSPLPWKSTSTAYLPPLAESLVADTHLSFCVVDKNIWDSSSTSLSEKLAAGRYWDIRGQNEWQQGEKWPDHEVRKILGVEVLGVVGAKGKDALDVCSNHFETLRRGWDYRNISWNDVDFAIMLGALVAGPKAEQKCRDLFQTMETLRFEQFLVPRAQLGAGLATAMGAMAILGTGGLAAPFVGPMVLNKFGASGARISKRDQIIWDQRMDAMRDLGHRLPQLQVLFDDTRSDRQ
ncbi:hypothetical protein OQA88_10668 [Cercophora sp. LCS_1]